MEKIEKLEDNIKSYKNKIVKLENENDDLKKEIKTFSLNEKNHQKKIDEMKNEIYSYKKRELSAKRKIEKTVYQNLKEKTKNNEIISCKKCGFENDSDAIFCNGCGCKIQK